MGEIKIKLLTDSEHKEFYRLESTETLTDDEFTRFVELLELISKERDLNLTPQEKTEQDEMLERWRKRDIFG